MTVSLPNRVREARPLVYAITNYVTMEWVARGLLAAGARPIMARDPNEAAAVAEHADALVLNLGTWSPEVQAAMLEAGRVANERGIPVVLDPVGAGGLASRTEAALALLSRIRVSVIRGNAGEIAALNGSADTVRGVDSRTILNETVAAKVARRFGCVVAATGAVDLVTDGSQTMTIRAGHPMMAQMPGTGCLSAALIAGALAVRQPEDSAVSLAADALLWAGLAGENGARVSQGPGTFAAAFLDQLDSVSALPEDRIAPGLADRLSVYVIVNGSTPLPVVTDILDAGVKAIQFREKHLPLPEQVVRATQVGELCRSRGALFLINDRVDLALAVKADGVHLGQEDLPVADARVILGPHAIIGATCETADEARVAMAQGADYLGTGPVYATASKADAGEPYGPAVVQRVTSAVPLPVVGIGGIDITKAAPVIHAGACGVSVIGAILNATEPGRAAALLLQEVLTAKGGTIL